MRLWKVDPGILAAAIALTACLGLGSVGCVFVNDDKGGSSSGTSGDQQQPPSELDANPVRAPIDTDQTLTSVPGQGVGMFVEYRKGGHWRIFTTCDTETPDNPQGVPCNFEGFVTAQSSSGSITDVVGEKLEAHDSFDMTSNNELHFVFQTASDTDGIWFDADPSAPIQLEMYLDGHAQKRFVSWVGNGVLHIGAPTDPIQLAPSNP